MTYSIYHCIISRNVRESGSPTLGLPGHTSSLYGIRLGMLRMVRLRMKPERWSLLIVSISMKDAEEQNCGGSYRF